MSQDAVEDLRMLDPVGFWSYARHDDAHSDGQLSQLRVIVGKSIGLQYGAEVMLWQDIAAIPFGADWAATIAHTIGQTTFFMPIITPRFLKSQNCLDEFRSFRQRMTMLGRNDLIFPLHYVNVDEMGPHDTVFGDDLASLYRHQWIDFRPLFYADPRGPEVRRWAGSLATGILKALRKMPPATPSRSASPPAGPETLGDATETDATASPPHEEPTIDPVVSARQSADAQTEQTSDAAAVPVLTAPPPPPMSDAMLVTSQDAETETLPSKEPPAVSTTADPAAGVADGPQSRSIDEPVEDITEIPAPQGVAEARPRRTQKRLVIAVVLAIAVLGAVGGVITLLTSYPLAYAIQANAGNVEAMAELGSYYEGKSSYVSAADWYQKAATAGNAYAMEHLGELYQNGQGVPQDLGKARELYEQAAPNGSSISVCSLAEFYDKGYGGPKDHDKALSWSRKCNSLN